MILAVLQARVSSTRLPGKVLADILGSPMILRQVERVMRAKNIDQLVVATSDRMDDDALADLCKAHGVEVFRGDLDDVLRRFGDCAADYGASHVVRLTGDCPLTDPEIIDRLISLHLAGNYDYCSSAVPPTFPDGLDAEIMTATALSAAVNEATLPSEREHVTPFIISRPERFRLGSLRNEEDLSVLRWTVDEKEDLEFVRQVYGHLYERNPAFTMQDVLDLLEREPALATVNKHIARNEGMTDSLRADDEIVSRK